MCVLAPVCVCGNDRGELSYTAHFIIQTQLLCFTIVLR